MPLRIPTQFWSRTLSTTSRARTTAGVPPQFHAYNAELESLTNSVPKLGKVAKWYLPSMAVLAIATMYFPTNLLESKKTSYTPHARTVTLDSANRQIGFAITNALGAHNDSFKAQQQQLTQDQKNQMLMDAFGDRSSLEDMERAFEQVEHEAAAAVDANERNRRLLEAYGEKTSLRDLERAMEIYEVQ